MNKTYKILIVCSMLMLASVAIYAYKNEPIGEIIINPNPMDKFTTITIQCRQEVNLGVNVETEQGLIIKTLYWGPASDQLQLTWNRLSDTGESVPSGTYVLVVNHQSRYTSTKKTLILK